MGPSLARCVLSGDGVRGPEEEGGDGMEVEGGDDTLSVPLDGSLVDRLPVSSAVALARWRLWRRFRQWIAKWSINMGISPFMGREIKPTGSPLEIISDSMPLVSVLVKCAQQPFIFFRCPRVPPYKKYGSIFKGEDSCAY